MVAAHDSKSCPAMGVSSSLTPGTVRTEPESQLVTRYLLYQAFTHMWFLGAVWLYFYRIYITDQQVGLVDGMAFAVGLLAEVPSGALADKFGRARIVKFGQLLIASGLIIQALGTHFMAFFIGQAIVMVGISFASGADEALFFNKFNYERTSAKWRKLVTRGTQAGLFGSVVALTVGGWLHTINPQIPWILTALSFICAVVAIWPIKDQGAGSVLSLSEEVREYINDIKVGFKQFFSNELWVYVPVILAVQGLFFAYGYGLLRLVLLDRFHFDAFWGSVVVAASSLITVAVLGYMHRYANNMHEKSVITVISLSAIVALLLAIPDIGVLGFFVILVLYAGEYTLYPFMSEILNYHAPEAQRATVLSVASFLRTLPYVFLAPVIGYINGVGKIEYFLVCWSIVIAIVLIFYLLKKTKTN